MARFRKRPIEIEAILWNGVNYEEVSSFTNGACRFDRDLYIDTLEGSMKAKIGDFIIKGIKGEFYPCDIDIFLDTYEVCEGQD
jgi:hypothetical protein